MHSLHDLSERFGDGLADSDVLENDVLIVLVARRVLLLTLEPGRRSGEARGDTMHSWACPEKEFVLAPVRDCAAAQGFCYAKVELVRDLLVPRPPMQAIAPI